MLPPKSLLFIIIDSFLTQKTFLKIHVFGCFVFFSPSPFAVLTFCSGKCIPTSFLGLSFQKNFYVCTKIKTLPNEKTIPPLPPTPNDFQDTEASTVATQKKNVAV